MGTAMEFTDANFQQEVLESDVPVLVDFWAPWCGPCRMIGPVIEELASENTGTFRVGKVNVDDNGSLAMNYNVSSIPAIMIFKGGQLVNQFMGVQSKEKLQQALDEAVGIGFAVDRTGRERVSIVPRPLCGPRVLTFSKRPSSTKPARSA